MGTSYTYDNAWTEERKRLDGIEAQYDAATIGVLGRIGVALGLPARRDRRRAHRHGPPLAGVSRRTCRRLPQGESRRRRHDASARLRPHFARRLPELFRRLGLVEIEAISQTQLTHGGSDAAAFSRWTMIALRDTLVSSGAATSAEIDQAVRLVDDPEFSWIRAPLTSAWARRPGPPG